MKPKTQQIGLITTSLVVGNMIGAGIFVLPAALANYGSISILGWIFSAADYVLVIIDKKLHTNNMIKSIVLGSLGFSYSLWAIYGSGYDTVFYGLLLLGVPFYIIMKWNNRK